MPTASATRRATALPPEERRAAIVAATCPLLARYGESVTTRQIAEAAGVAEGTIFRVFADKDALLEAALDAALDLGPLEEALAAVDRALPLEERLVAATALIQQRIVEVWELLSGVGPRLHEKAARPLADSPQLVRLIAPDRRRLRLAPEAVARLLRSFTLAVSHPKLVERPMDPADIVAFVLRGVAR